MMLFAHHCVYDFYVLLYADCYPQVPDKKFTQPSAILLNTLSTET